MSWRWTNLSSRYVTLSDRNVETFQPGGREELVAIAREYAKPAIHDGSHPTSRADEPAPIPLKTVSPEDLLYHAPWMEAYYHTYVLEVARKAKGGDVAASRLLQNYPMINLTPLGVGYEPHIDSNRFTVLELLYGNPNETDGGALSLSPWGDVPGSEIDTESYRSSRVVRYYPVVGEVAVFDGFLRTHKVEPLMTSERIMLVSNLWTPGAPEEERAEGVDRYSLGVPIPEPID